MGRSATATRLLQATSALAFVGGVFLATTAHAACTGPAVIITSSSSATTLDSTPTCPSSVTIATGATAILTPSYGNQSNATSQGWVPLINNSGALTTTSGAPQGGDLVGPITVQQGATLVFGGEQTYGTPLYEPVNNLVTAAGNVVFEGNGGFTGGNQYGLTGTTTLAGNVTLEAGANVRVGEYYGTAGGTLGNYTVGGTYAASTVIFGPNTNVMLEGTTGVIPATMYNGPQPLDALLFLNLNAPAVIGGYLSATAESEVWLHAGSLTINGADTAVNPFVGALQIDGGATVIVGDSTHPGAILGDPGNTNGSTFTLNITNGGGSPAILKGYGTIYGTVLNSGFVQPGGGATPGTLTVSQYTQNATGILSITVTPGGASELKVLGTANLGGTLALTIAPGNYGNAVLPIISASAITGKFASITTSGSSAAGLAETATSYDVVTELTSAAQVFGHLVTADRGNLTDFADALYDVQTTTGANSAFKTTYASGLVAWIEPFGRTSRLSHEGLGFNTTSEGLTAGLEHGLGPNAVAGVSVSYANETLNTDGGATHSTSDTVDLGLYGGYTFENARVEAVGFYNTYSATVSRSLGSAGVIGSSPGGSAFGASLQISNPIFGNIVEPYLRMTFSDIRQGGVTEKSANLLALNIASSQKGYFDGEAGFKLHPGNLPMLAGSPGIANLHPEITLAAQHDFTQNPGESVSASFANLSGSPFLYNWKGDQGTAGLVGLMLSGDVASRFNVYGKIDARFSSYAQSGEIRVGAAYRF